MKDRVSADHWFSCSLGFVWLVGDDPAATEAIRSVRVFRAPDWDAAFERALQLGYATEQSYKNGDGEQVRIVLVSVETLDLLGTEVEDGREVFFEVAPERILREMFPTAE